jgi:hypothetical protein
MRVRIESSALSDAPRAAFAGLPADLAFCHPDIQRVIAIDPEGVELEVAATGADLLVQVARVLELSIASYRFVRDEPPLWCHDALARYVGGRAALARFVDDRTITLGPGQYVLVGAAARLRAWLDERLQVIAAAVAAEPWHLPSIEQTSDLIARTGYLASHGQHVTFGYRLPCHFERLQDFASAARERRLERPDDPRELVPTGFILEPFVCHNVYRALAGARIEGGRAITALGTCYRHEGFRFEPLLRQWEFSMREVVLVGPAGFVAATRDRLVTLTEELVRELDLDARLEIATDPFFVGEALSARTFQAVRSTKLELVLGLDRDARTAACSFNLHRDHFTAPMRIAGSDGGPLETACVGWGLERWIAAIVARWGASPDAWPVP